MTAPLRFLSQDTLLNLYAQISDNLERYATHDFKDLAEANGWAIESKVVQVDYDALSELNGNQRSAESDVANSRIVHAALPGMTPAIAADERIWARLTHVECLEYSRKRWLLEKSGESLLTAIHLHMFARGRTGIRDDNALSRLWWNMEIASIADPDDPAGALELIMKRADVRMQFVERPGSAARRSLARAVVRGMRREPWLLSSEESFRAFMIVLNRNGGGVLFEALSEDRADVFMDECIVGARVRLGQ